MSHATNGRQTAFEENSNVSPKRKIKHRTPTVKMVESAYSSKRMDQTMHGLMHENHHHLNPKKKISLQQEAIKSDAGDGSSNGNKDRQQYSRIRS
jgi:hypothetical protein